MPMRINNFINQFCEGIKTISSGMDSLIIFVTTNCSCRCKFCFFHNELNKNKELEFEKLEKISQSIGHFRTLMLSGGEPFSRNDLPQIALLFQRNNDIRNMGIPTNGIQSAKIVKTVEKILEENPKLVLKINLSIDALKDLHDEMRGRKGTFNSAMRTLEMLIELRADYLNLEVNVTSVLCIENLYEIDRLSDFIKKYHVNHHQIEMVRGDAAAKLTMGEKKIICEKYLKIHHISYDSTYNYTPKDHPGKNIFIAKLRSFFSSSHAFYQAKVESEIISFGKDWGFPCRAGKNIFTIYPEGDLAVCELRSPVLNLSEYNFNFSKAIKSKELKNELKKIKSNKCFCTHGCFISVSMLKSLKITFIKAPIYFLRLKRASR